MGYVFQLSPTANDIARSLAAAVAEHVKPRKIALLNENTDAGRDFSRITREWFQQNAKDAEVVADEFVDRGVTDLTPQFAKIKRVGAQAIVGEIYGSSGPVLFNQWFELRVPAVVRPHGGDGGRQSFIDQHAKAVEGAIINNRWWPARYSEVSEPMMAAYKKRTGTDRPTSPCRPTTRRWSSSRPSPRPGAWTPTRSAGHRERHLAMAWGTRKFTPLAEGHRMPIQTVVIQVQGGKKVPIYPAAVASKAVGSTRPGRPTPGEKK